ncbi:PREDICTED: uncharacterized protein LOC106808485 isoform X2 [Priapulus caudatus]|uniref:Uncharacterized protein LOC106808485 isoform X2 n=1 Tax=Priapulus caudatus TaxID=37621 RepID=A0ABM1E3D4_PRICU|nr:PREDICTED: uncharacterized protein LOC106808485 isoform X2 [Priapulus caudatus]
MSASPDQLSNSEGGSNQLEKDFKKYQADHHLTLTTVKQKIASTDLLLRKFSGKCADFDAQARKLEEISTTLERVQRYHSPTSRLLHLWT